MFCAIVGALVVFFFFIMPAVSIAASVAGKAIIAADNASRRDYDAIKAAADARGMSVGDYMGMRAARAALEKVQGNREP